MATNRKSFIPARPTSWFIGGAQALIRADLALTNRLYLEEQDLQIFKQLPAGSGVVLASNHADETDPLVCLELARRSGLRLITMCNREAFDENFGLAGWALQRLGYFSVKRGAHDSEAKTFATSVVKTGREVLLIFPEGEIYYLNEEVQPFHSGTVDICLQAITENRKNDPNWTAYIVPMVIKYHCEKPIESTLEGRVAKMETDLSLKAAGTSLAERLVAIQRLLLEREAGKHNVDRSVAAQQRMTQGIDTLERSMVAEVSQRYGQAASSAHLAPIDQAWQLAAEINDALDQETDENRRIELQNDLSELKRAEQLSSWRPHYYLEHATPDRLAEVVLKLERQLYNIKRPRQLANRNVFVKISEPINMHPHLADYETDPHSVRHRITLDLHERIQSLIDVLASQARKS